MNIFVGNLSFNLTDQELREAFEAYGQVQSAVIIKDKMSGQPRGFGFVEMASREEAEAAIQALNGKDLKGRRINVNEARPRDERPAGGGGPRRSGGGGGGGFGGGGFGGGGGGGERKRNW